VSRNNVLAYALPIAIGHDQFALGLADLGHQRIKTDCQFGPRVYRGHHDGEPYPLGFILHHVIHANREKGALQANPFIKSDR
jgi:hypothetical protein